MADSLDGRIGEGWSGEAPKGAHMNVVVARRGSATYAALVAELAASRPGHLPFLACVRLGEVVRPATLIVNKATFTGEERHERRLAKVRAIERDGLEASLEPSV